MAVRHIENVLTIFIAENYCKNFEEEEKDLIRNRKWIEMIRRGVIFFVLEKMAAVLGVSNPEVYAAFRGETIEQFQATRKVSMKYSVAGGNKVKEIDCQ